MFKATWVIKGAAFALGLFASATCSTLLAQDAVAPSTPNHAAEQQNGSLTAKLERLEFIQGVLSQKINQRSRLGEKVTGRKT